GLLYLWIRNLRQRIRVEEITTRFATLLFSQNTVEKPFGTWPKTAFWFWGLRSVWSINTTKRKTSLSKKHQQASKEAQKIKWCTMQLKFPWEKALLVLQYKAKKSSL